MLTAASKMGDYRDVTTHNGGLVQLKTTRESDGVAIEDACDDKLRRLAIHDERRQSPVNIDFEHTSMDPALNKLLYGYHVDLGARLVNDGKLPICYFTPGTHMLKGGPLDETYELYQYHIHFAGESHGSEHALNGAGYAAEIHFVHYKKEYGGFQASLAHGDGLAVVGVFIDSDNNNDSAFNKQLNADVLKMENIAEYGAEYNTSVDLTQYRLSENGSFFTYSGSLTSEPHQECVQWILLKEPISISNEAFDVLKRLQAQSGQAIFEAGNSRTIQPRCGRKVRCNFHLNEAR